MFGAGAVLVALGLSGPARAAPAEISADTLTVKDGIATGEGGVRVTFQDQIASGQSFTYDLSSGRLVIERGTWSRPEGALSFERAEIQVGDGAGLVLAGTYEGRDGRLKVEGDRLAWVDEGALEGEGVRFTTCDCPVPAWSVSARQVHVTLDEVATFRGAWISVCERPVLPVPAGRFPLAERASGLLPPSVGLGEDGLVLAEPVYLTLGPSADLTLSPELRTLRGARLLTEGRYALAQGEGVARAVGGWDWAEGAARGAIDLDHRSTAGRAWAAADALWWSDADYGADYGDSWFSRHAPWTEARGQVGWGPLALESDTFQADTAQTQAPIALVARLASPIGPVSAQGEARLDGLGNGARLSEIEGLSPRALGRAQLTWGPDLDVLRLSGTARLWGVARPGEVPWGQTDERLHLGLPLWAPLPRGTFTAEIGATGALSQDLGSPDPQVPDEALAPAWSVGPVLELRLVTGAGVPLSASLRAPDTPSGWRPQGELRLQRGPWSAQAWGTRQVQSLALARDDGSTAAGLDAARGEALTQARTWAAATLPGRWSAWRPSVNALVDLDEPALLSVGGGLRLRPACDCVQAELSATVSQDRAWPDLGLNVSVW